MATPRRNDPVVVPAKSKSMAWCGGCFNNISKGAFSFPTISVLCLSEGKKGNIVIF